MMESDKVGEGGQVAFPAAFLKAAALKPGDFGHFTVTGPNTIELSFCRRLTVDEMFERYRIDGPIDLAADREAMYEEMAEEFSQRFAENSLEAERNGDDRPGQNGTTAASPASDERRPLPVR